jgi:hypothetical protein
MDAPGQHIINLREIRPFFSIFPGSDPEEFITHWEIWLVDYRDDWEFTERTGLVAYEHHPITRHEMLSCRPEVVTIDPSSRTSRDGISKHRYLLRCTPPHSQCTSVISRSIRRRLVRAVEQGFWLKRSHHRDHLVLRPEILPMEFFLEITEYEEITGGQFKGIRWLGQSGESQLFSFR